MGASRRQWRAIERAQIKDAARQVRARVRAEREEAQRMHDAAIAIAESGEVDTFTPPTEPTVIPQPGGPVYALPSEFADAAE